MRIVDFGNPQMPRRAERTGRQRGKEVENGPNGSAVEVRRLPHQFAATPATKRDGPRKNPNAERLGFR